MGLFTVSVCSPLKNYYFDALIYTLYRQDHDRKGLGGIFLEDLQESLPRCEKIVARLLEDNKIIVIHASADKRKVVFLRENAEKLQVT